MCVSRSTERTDHGTASGTPHRALALAAMLGAALTGLRDRKPPSSGADATPQATETPAGELTEFDAAWLDGGRQVGLVTQGSSTCIPTAEDVSYPTVCSSDARRRLRWPVHDGLRPPGVPRPGPRRCRPVREPRDRGLGDYVGEMVLPVLRGLPPRARPSSVAERGMDHDRRHVHRAPVVVLPAAPSTSPPPGLRRRGVSVSLSASRRTRSARPTSLRIRS